MATTDRNTNLSKVTLIPARITSEAQRLTPESAFLDLPFWDKFDANDQASLIQETKLLAGAKVAHAGTKLAMGQYLSNIHKICGRRYEGTFKEIASRLNIKERQAYRLKDAFNAARVYLPDNVLVAATVAGLEISHTGRDTPLGKYTEVIRLFPPSKNPTDQQAMDYIPFIMKKQKERMRQLRDGKEVEVAGPEDIEEQSQIDPKKLSLECYRSIRSALRVMSPAQKRRWFESLVGYAMPEAGFQGTKMFEAQAPPEEFTRERGRPLQVHEAVA